MDQILRRDVLLRDGGCVARFVTSKLELQRWPMFAGLPDPGPCRDRWGRWIDPHRLDGMTVDHVEMDGEMSFASKPPDDMGHLWAVCPGHHVTMCPWVTRADVRAAARLYIPAANAVKAAA